MELVLSDSGRVCMHLGTSICDTHWIRLEKLDLIIKKEIVNVCILYTV